MWPTLAGGVAGVIGEPDGRDAPVTVEPVDLPWGLRLSILVQKLWRARVRAEDARGWRPSVPAAVEEPPIAAEPPLVVPGLGLGLMHRLGLLTPTSSRSRVRLPVVDPTLTLPPTVEPDTLAIDDGASDMTEPIRDSDGDDEHDVSEPPFRRARLF